MDHPTDCICISCAPISLPTRSPIINHLLAGKGNSALAQGLMRAHELHVREINRAALLAKCGFGVEGKAG